MWGGLEGTAGHRWVLVGTAGCRWALLVPFLAGRTRGWQAAPGSGHWPRLEDSSSTPRSSLRVGASQMQGACPGSARGGVRGAGGGVAGHPPTPLRAPQSTTRTRTVTCRWRRSTAPSAPLTPPTAPTTPPPTAGTPCPRPPCLPPPVMPAGDGAPAGHGGPSAETEWDEGHPGGAWGSKAGRSLVGPTLGGMGKSGGGPSLFRVPTWARSGHGEEGMHHPGWWA